MDSIINQKGQLTDQINNIKVSVGLRVTNSSYLDTVTSFYEITDTIKNDKDIKDKIEVLSQIEFDDDQQEYKKNNLPFFATSTFKQNRRLSKELESTQLMILDYDHLDDDMNEKRNSLMADPKVLCLFSSPRGGLKVIYRFSEEITDHNKYSALYKYYAKKFGASLGLDPDKTSDAARPCYFSYDPDLYINYEADVLDVNVPEADLQLLNKKERSENDILELNLAFKGAKNGNRRTALTRMVGMFVSRKIPKENIYDLLTHWNNSLEDPLSEEEFNFVIDDFYKRNAEKEITLPVNYYEFNDATYKKVNSGDESKEIMVSSFRVTPLELLVTDDGDCLVCDVTSSLGNTYEDIKIENTDWHTRSKLLKAIGHQDCSFIGSDTELQAFCNYINSKVPVKKIGVRQIGLINDTWVVDGMNITKDKISDEPNIIAVSKGSDSFINKISYESITATEYEELVKGLYTNIIKINEPGTIYPLIGWFFASAVKPFIMEIDGGFPHFFAYGGMGDGKTSTAKLFTQLSGYNNDETYSCTMKSFPMLKLLSSSTSIFIPLDEFKKQDMAEHEIEQFQRFLRKAYSGEVESKGKADQTVIDYKLSAPIMVLGEWNITQPAIRERVISANFGKYIKTNKDAQLAFETIKLLNLKSFMPRYIKFILNQDIEAIYKRCKKIIRTHFKEITVAPRIVNNLSVMLLGLLLFKMFGKKYGVYGIRINLADLLNSQLENITGTRTGLVRSAVDQLIEELAVMAANHKLEAGYDYKTLDINSKSSTSVRVLAINFTKVYPTFSEWTRRTGYDGDYLGKHDYLKLFDDTEYIVAKDHNVKYLDKNARSLVIDYKKALDAGLNLDGFNLE